MAVAVETVTPPVPVPEPVLPLLSQNVENSWSQPDMEVSGNWSEEIVGAFWRVSALTMSTNWLLAESQPRSLIGTGIQSLPVPILMTTYCIRPVIGSTIMSSTAFSLEPVPVSLLAPPVEGVEVDTVPPAEGVSVASVPVPAAGVSVASVPVPPELVPDACGLITTVAPRTSVASITPCSCMPASPVPVPVPEPPADGVEVEEVEPLAAGVEVDEVEPLAAGVGVEVSPVIQ